MLYYLLMLCTSNSCCAIKKIRDYQLCGLFGKCTCDVIKRFLILQRCSPPLFYPPMRLCMGFIAAKAAAGEAARMAARARRARQLIGKEIFRCY